MDDVENLMAAMAALGAAVLISVLPDLARTQADRWLLLLASALVGVGGLLWLIAAGHGLAAGGALLGYVIVGVQRVVAQMRSGLASSAATAPH